MYACPQQGSEIIAYLLWMLISKLDDSHMEDHVLKMATSFIQNVLHNVQVHINEDISKFTMREFSSNQNIGISLPGSINYKTKFSCDSYFGITHII